MNREYLKEKRKKKSEEVRSKLRSFGWFETDDSEDGIRSTLFEKKGTRIYVGNESILLKDDIDVTVNMEDVTLFRGCIFLRSSEKVVVRVEL